MPRLRVTVGLFHTVKLPPVTDTLPVKPGLLNGDKSAKEDANDVPLSVMVGVDTEDENVPDVPERAPLSVVIPPTAKLLMTDALLLTVTPVVASMLRILSETAGVAAEEIARINPLGCCKTPAAGDVNVFSTVVPAVTDPLVLNDPVKLPPESGRYDPPVIATPLTVREVQERAPVTDRAPLTVAWLAAS